MTEQESQEIKDTALLNYVKGKRALGLATERVNQTASQMEDVAKTLRKGTLSSYKFIPRFWLNSEALAQMLEDVEKAQAEYSDVYESALEAGVPVPY